VAYLLDTNVALRWALPVDPLSPLIREAVFRIHDGGSDAYVTAQVLIELQALATRPVAANGLGFTTANASGLARQIETVFPLLPETAEIYPLWRTLVDSWDIRGRQVFDARLVAVMQAHRIEHILTLNPGHFRRFNAVNVVEPVDLLASS
jgi:predicted nucleic acid-binding protein